MTSSPLRNQLQGLSPVPMKSPTKQLRNSPVHVHQTAAVPRYTIRPPSTRKTSHIITGPAKDYFAGTWDEFRSLEVHPEDDILWWKVPDLRPEHLHDWELDVLKVNERTSMICGVLKSSPYFTKLDKADRFTLLRMSGAPPGKFDSAADEFEAKELGKIKHRTFVVKLNGFQIGLYRFGTEIFAIENKCPHLAGPLGLGDIEELDGRICVRCPSHSWRIELASGKIWQPFRPDLPSATVFPVKVEGSEVFVGFAEYTASVFQDLDF